MAKTKVGIVGITGYTGEELLKILSRHAGVEIAVVAGRASIEVKHLSEIYPHFSHLDIKCEALDISSVCKRVDIVFLALPHKVSFEVIPGFLKENKKVIDLSADFRLNDAHVYEKWYGVKHSGSEFLKQAVYGLPEVYRKAIRQALLVANPGCYPTTVMLGLIPAVKNGIIDLSSIIIDAKSGISGAGRKTSEEYFKNEHPNFRPYNIGGMHRHIPEIEQELSKAAAKNVVVTFTPQIIPVERGMVSTIYSSLKSTVKTKDVLEQYREFFADEPFVRVLDEGKIPDLKGVVNTNYCDIGVKVDERTNRLIVISAIDNLVKGASGQAVQNMNIMFGFEEIQGLI